MLVCFDATVLCGAIRKPTGYNFKLLELAAGGTVLSGFTTDVAAAVARDADGFARLIAPTYPKARLPAASRSSDQGVWPLSLAWHS